MRGTPHNGKGSSLRNISHSPSRPQNTASKARQASKILYALSVGTLPESRNPRFQELKEGRPPPLGEYTSHSTRPLNLQLSKAALLRIQRRSSHNSFRGFTSGRKFIRPRDTWQDIFKHVLPCRSQLLPYQVRVRPFSRTILHLLPSTIHTGAFTAISIVTLVIVENQRLHFHSRSYTMASNCTRSYSSAMACTSTSWETRL